MESRISSKGGGVGACPMPRRYAIRRDPGRVPRVGWWGRVYLTERTGSLVLESQLPHIIVNLLFTCTNWSIAVTVLWGVVFRKLIDKHIL